MFLIWILYHLWFIVRAAWFRHIQGRKLLMNSDEVAKEVDEKFPQFLMSWKHFLEIKDKHGGSAEKWMHHRQESEKFEAEAAEKEIWNAKKKEKEEEEKGKKKATQSMEFG